MPLRKVINGNEHYSEQQIQERNDYFKSLTGGQSPEFLWFSCCDSRVSPDIIAEGKDGDFFVTRNIANQFNENDTAQQAIVHYATAVLGIKKIIVCGHSHCGGIAAALQGGDLGILTPTIAPLHELYLQHQTEVDAATSEEHKIELLSMLNAKHQAANLRVSKLLADFDDVAVHAMFYDIGEGKLKQLG